VSFLLVIFYSSPKALGAGILTALTNRIGDALILLGIRLMLEWHGHLELVRLAGQPVASGIIIVAAITKRAQFPFSSWLPAAIEAPTPVSALVHSSTLVTAGVYLIIRFYSFLSQSLVFNGAILLFGVVTRFFAGIAAIAELDLKKIIALSTLSQLGLIIMSIGLGYPALALFHLITHAMFKALLFVCGGILIHFHGHAQDLRRIGNIGSQLPVVRSSISISRFALCAVPFISGFYSKDAILEGLFWSSFAFVIIFLSMGATVLTTAYSVRLLIRTIFSIQKRDPTTRFSEPARLPMMILGIGALFSGAIILGVRGPFALEPLNPLVKRVFSFFLFFRTVLVCSSYIKKVNFIGGRFIYSVHSARRKIFFLRGISTQRLISSSIELRKAFCKSDQS